MKKHKTNQPIFSEAIGNLQLLLSYLLHFRQPDKFISKQNIAAAL